MRRETRGEKNRDRRIVELFYRSTVMLTEGPSLLFVRFYARVVRSRTGLVGPIIILAWNLCDVIAQAIWRGRASHTLPRVSIDLNFMLHKQLESYFLLLSVRKMICLTVKNG